MWQAGYGHSGYLSHRIHRILRSRYHWGPASVQLGRVTDSPAASPWHIDCPQTVLGTHTLATSRSLVEDSVAQPTTFEREVRTIVMGTEASSSTVFSFLSIGQVEVPILGAGSAFALAAIDVVYVLKRRISPVYLLDKARGGGELPAWRWSLLLVCLLPSPKIALEVFSD